MPISTDETMVLLLSPEIPRHIRHQTRRLRLHQDSDRKRTARNFLRGHMSLPIKARFQHRNVHPLTEYHFASPCPHAHRSRLRLRLRRRMVLIAMITINQIYQRPRNQFRLLAGMDRRSTLQTIFLSTHGLQSPRRKTRPRRHMGLAVTVISGHVLHRVVLARVCLKTL
jgi:hypothetical protein